MNFAHKLMHKEKEKINKRAKTYDFRAVGSEPKQNRKQGCENFWSYMIILNYSNWSNTRLNERIELIMKEKYISYLFSFARILFWMWYLTLYVIDWENINSFLKVPKIERKALAIF